MPLTKKQIVKQLDKITAQLEVLQICTYKIDSTLHDRVSVAKSAALDAYVIATALHDV